jgi:hypothetical protein
MSVGVIVRREGPWTPARETPARELVRSARHPQNVIIHAEFRGFALRAVGDCRLICWPAPYLAGNGPNGWSREQFYYDRVSNC